MLCHACSGEHTHVGPRVGKCHLLEIFTSKSSKYQRHHVRLITSGGGKLAARRSVTPLGRIVGKRTDRPLNLRGQSLESA